MARLEMVFDSFFGLWQYQMMILLDVERWNYKDVRPYRCRNGEELLLLQGLYKTAP